jgi:hypothetical protein
VWLSLIVSCVCATLCVFPLQIRLFGLDTLLWLEATKKKQFGAGGRKVTSPTSSNEEPVLVNLDDNETDEECMYDSSDDEDEGKQSLSSSDRLFLTLT